MVSTEQIATRVEWLKGLRSSLEIGERLESEYGLGFTQDEKDMLKFLREKLPLIQTQMAKVKVP